MDTFTTTHEPGQGSDGAVRNGPNREGVLILEVTIPSHLTDPMIEGFLYYIETVWAALCEENGTATPDSAINN